MAQEAKFDLTRGSSVEVRAVYTGSGKDRTRHAEIEVDGKYVHRFPSNSRVSKHLDIMTPADLSQRLTGGSFFFIDEQQGDGPQMVDFRDGQYASRSFIHTDESVAKFMEVIGFEHQDKLPLHRRKKSEADISKLVLRKVWGSSEIQVPGYQSGGEFNSRLSYLWSPYNKNIDSAFDLVRLICTNGMVGLTSFLNTKIPLQNRWEEHLDIASRQIQNKVSSIVVDRVRQMEDTRASVADCLLLEQHIFERLHANGAKADGEREMLLQLIGVISPSQHLGNLYKDDVFLNKALAAQLPSHLSYFDVWNIATEVRSHTASTGKSSDNALDKFANGIMFDQQDNYSTGSHRTAPAASAFSDPERAFFGSLGH